MFFNSEDYLKFFSIVLVLYWVVPALLSHPKFPISWQSIRVWFLVGCSYYFYYQWSKELAFLVASTTVMDFLIARLMDNARTERVRKLFLATSLIMNLGLLCYFKYANFFLESLRQLLHSMNADSSIPLLEVIVPFGISFYTFEAISYVLDVYHHRIPAERNLGNFMLFILFFPHLVSGPIVRPYDFLPQVEKPKKFSWMRLQLGFEYFLIGAFKKMVIADRMAMYSDVIFQNPENYSNAAIWLGVVAFAVRIYCDFSGYTDMAIGSAHMLGYKLSINFRMPYLSKNVGEFWRRWHISLSSWLRDYLYINLGGNRGSTWFTMRNLMLTMLLGGLWHGANWTYLIWGGLHGTFLVIHRFFAAWCKTKPKVKALFETKLGKCYRVCLTILAVISAWVFFQPSLGVALEMLSGMYWNHPGQSTLFPTQSFWILLSLVVVGHWIGSNDLWRRWKPLIPAPILGSFYAIAIALILLLTPDTTRNFIYFNF